MKDESIILDDFEAPLRELVKEIEEEQEKDEKHPKKQGAFLLGKKYEEKTKNKT